MQRRLRMMGIGLGAAWGIIILMMSISASVQAQFRPTPVPYLPGTPIYTPVGPVFTVALTACHAALPFHAGDLIYIEAGVNIRNQPDLNGALVWNTMYDNRDEEGQPLDEPKAIPVIIQEGPVCSDGYNWWRIAGTENPGWVAEGRPDIDGGYFLTGPQIAEASAACQSAIPIKVGEAVELVYNVRIRQDPSLSGRTKTVVPFKTPIQVISGPRCLEARVWWYVRASVNNFPYEGWMASGEFDQQYILPLNLPSTEAGTLCIAPMKLPIGQRAYVDYDDTEKKALRSEPGVQSPLLVRLVDGVPFIVEGGPICKDNYNWWKIRVLDSVPVIGWMAEGGPANYWITILDPNEYAH